MVGFDADIGWMDSQAMVMCSCKHYYRSHRPISRKCSLCECPQFSVEENHPAPVQAGS
jgi:hypothetical protein